MGKYTWNLRDISKKYGKKQAVCATTMDLPEGLHALLGPNGSGKTTLMSMLAGILKPTTGRILVNGQLLSREAYQKEIAFLPQSFGSYGAFTVPGDKREQPVGAGAVAFGECVV